MNFGISEPARMESPRPAGRISRPTALEIVVVAVGLLALTSLIYFFIIVPRTETIPWPNGPAYNPVGLNATRQGNGDWTIAVTSGGGFKPADVLMQVTNNSTGMMALQARLNKINASDGIFTDNNRN